MAESEGQTDGGTEQRGLGLLLYFALRELLPRWKTDRLEKDGCRPERLVLLPECQFRRTVSGLPKSVRASRVRHRSELTQISVRLRPFPMFTSVRPVVGSTRKNSSIRVQTVLGTCEVWTETLDWIEPTKSNVAQSASSSWHASSAPWRQRNPEK